MTNDQMIATIRRRLDDTKGGSDDGMFSDDLLYDYLGQIQEEMAVECRLIHDSTTPEYCLIPVVAGTKEYPTDEIIMEILEAVYTVTSSGESRTLEWSQTHLFSKGNPLPTGTPNRYSTDRGQYDLTLDKVPDEIASIRLHTIRRPINMPSASHQLEIPPRYHLRMIEGVLALAYLKPDIETYNPVKAKVFEMKHANNVEQVKREELRSRPRVMRPRW